MYHPKTFETPTPCVDRFRRRVVSPPPKGIRAKVLLSSVFGNVQNRNITLHQAFEIGHASTKPDLEKYFWPPHLRYMGRSGLIEG